VSSRGLVIFDVDGTLFDTAAAVVPAVADAFRRFGLDPPLPERVCDFFGRPWSEFRAWVRSNERAERSDELLRVVGELELRYVEEKGRLFDGVRELLATLAGEGRQLAVCSNGSESYVQRVLSAHGIEPVFDAVRCRAAGDDSKTRMLAELLRRLAGRPAVMVGDRGDDVEAARANGIAAVAVGYGYGRSGELEQAPAVARTVAEATVRIREILDAG